MKTSKSGIKHEDGLHRRFWCGTDPVYVAYHDDEWGVPERDSQALFEKLLLDGFQAGLSWITILRKREAFRAAFDRFDPAKIARYGAAERERLMADSGIVRNRAKIAASVGNAIAYLAIEEKQGFAPYLWGFLDGKPIQNAFRGAGEIPPETPLARTISKDLQQRGFKFVGPTIVYAFMQAVGMVNDHVVTCHRHATVERLSMRRG